MNRVVKHGCRNGCIKAPPSKSFAHRRLIASALTFLQNKQAISSWMLDDVGNSDDVVATVQCLNEIILTYQGEQDNQGDGNNAFLLCRESGSTLRFLLPVVAALGISEVFRLEGRLSQRPIDALLTVCSEHGAKIKKGENTLSVSGQLLPGKYIIPGNISSGFITGLLFALPLLDGESTLTVIEPIQSKNYIDMTEKVLTQAQIKFYKDKNQYTIPGNQRYLFASSGKTEKDWSSAAFMLCAGVFSTQGISVEGLLSESLQADKQIISILQQFGAEINTSKTSVTVKKKNLYAQQIDAAQIPDLIPTVSIVAACAKGETRITNAQRLRLKETDRIATTVQMLHCLGVQVQETNDGMLIAGKEQLTGGTVDSMGDHRIAMAAAVAACNSKTDVTISNSECVSKSYENFWCDFDFLNIE